MSEEKNIVGIDLEFKIAFKEAVDAEVGVSTLNKIENEIMDVCNKNNVVFKGGLGNFVRVSK